VGRLIKLLTEGNNESRRIRWPRLPCYVRYSDEETDRTRRSSELNVTAYTPTEHGWKPRRWNVWMLRVFVWCRAVREHTQNDSVPKMPINDTINLLFKSAVSISLVSNHNSFRVPFDKIASAYFIRKVYLYFSIGNGQPGEPALCQLYRHTFVTYRPYTHRCAVRFWAGDVLPVDEESGTSWDPWEGPRPVSLSRSRVAFLAYTHLSILPGLSWVWRSHWDPHGYGYGVGLGMIFHPHTPTGILWGFLINLKYCVKHER